MLRGLTAGRTAPPPPGASSAAWSRSTLAAAVCDWLLEGLGATLVASGFDIAPARLVPSSVTLPEEGLPHGTIGYATGVTLAAAALAGWLAGRPFEVPETAVAVQVRLPEVLAASYRSPRSMRPPPPLAAPGGGWLAADLGAPGDRESFETLLATLGAGPTAAEVALAAQEWRLPVCDYGPRPTEPPASFPISTGDAAPADAPLSGPPHSVRTPAGASPQSSPARLSARPLACVSVCDLTAMWAGPLATWLLAGLGATVHKVEPPFRPDGMRALDGRGIHPGGRQVDPGGDSAMWNALNNNKRLAPLDLRDAADRAAFTALAGSCDVVIDSFSPRVMPNFGLSVEIASGPARPVMVSMPAFPPGPRRDWVAYGTGVHAVLGLGDRCDGTFESPAVSYPDPLAGLTAALAVLAALASRRLGEGPRRVEVALESASRPLLRASPGSPRRAADDGPSAPGAALLAAAVEEGLVEARDVAGERLAHPLAPLRPAAPSP